MLTQVMTFTITMSAEFYIVAALLPGDDEDPPISDWIRRVNESQGRDELEAVMGEIEAEDDPYDSYLDNHGIYIIPSGITGVDLTSDDWNEEMAIARDQLHLEFVDGPKDDYDDDDDEYDYDEEGDLTLANQTSEEIPLDTILGESMWEEIEDGFDLNKYEWFILRLGSTTTDWEYTSEKGEEFDHNKISIDNGKGFFYDGKPFTQQEEYDDPEYRYYAFRKVDPVDGAISKFRKYFDQGGEDPED